MEQSITHAHVRALLGDRPKDSYKGKNGRGLLLAGSPGFTGAALMAATAALRAGIGTLKVLCPASVQATLYTLPEAMVNTFAGSWDAIDPVLLQSYVEGCDCIAIGPGMGPSAGVEHTLHLVLAAEKPVVIDADGLNALSGFADKKAVLHKKAILTPHLGEMARLSGHSVAEIEATPAAMAKRYAAVWGCTLLLKGAVSHVAAPDGRIMQNESGNPGLAKGGSGDILTGICLAMLGQKLEPFDAACAAAYILGASAERAFDVLRERMLMARDVRDMIQSTIPLVDNVAHGF